jgi:HK97 family phage major capsid protein
MTLLWSNRSRKGFALTNARLQRFYESAAADLDDFGELSIKGLIGRGFDVQNGNLMVETARGPWPVAPAYVAPGGGAVPKHFEQSIAKERAVLTSNYANAWNKWFGYAIVQNGFGGTDLAMKRLSETEKNALFEGMETSGGVTVPPQLAAEVLSRMAGNSVVRSRAHVVPTISDTLQLPAFAPNSTSASTYSSDWLAGWAVETPSSNSTDPSFETFDIAVRKARTGVLRVSKDLSDDAPAALGWLVEVGSSDLALVTDAGFVAGNGLSNQPRGLLESGSTEVDIEGSTANTISNTTTNAGSAPKIASLLENLPAQYRRNATMIGSTTGEAALMKLVDGDGSRMYRRGQPVEGLRLDVSPFMEADGSNGNVPLLAGDLSAYVIAQRSLSVRILSERFAEFDQIGVVLIERVGGGLWNTDAVRLGVV